MLRLALGLLVFLLFLGGTITILFQSSYVQTRLTQWFASYMYNEYSLRATIQEVSIDLFGRTSFEDLVVYDYRNDTLLSATAVSLNLVDAKIKRDTLKVSTLVLEQPYFNWYTVKGDSTSNLGYLLRKFETDSSASSESSNFFVQLESLSIQNGRFNEIDSNIGRFNAFLNYEFLQLHSINAELQNIGIQTNNLAVTAELTNFSAMELGGLQLHELHALVEVTNQKIAAIDLNLRFNSSQIKGNASLYYSDFNEFTNFLDSVSFKGNIQADLNLYDINYWATDSFLPPLQVQLKGNFGGPVNRLLVKNLLVTHEDFAAKGSVRLDETASENIHFFGQQVQVNTSTITGLKIAELFAGKENLEVVDAYKNQLTELNATIDFTGDLQDFTSDIWLTTNLGSVQAKTDFVSTGSLHELFVDATTKAFDLQPILGEFKVQNFGGAIQAKVDFTSTNFSTISSTLKSNYLTFNQYRYLQNWVDFKYDSTGFSATVASSDPNFNLSGNVIQTKNNLEFNGLIHYADLYKTNLYNDSLAYLKTQVFGSTEWPIDLQQLTASVDFSQLEFGNAIDTFSVRGLSLLAKSENGLQNIQLETDFGSTQIKGAFNPTTIANSLMQAIELNQYGVASDTTIYTDQDFSYTINFINLSELVKPFVPGLEIVNDVQAFGSYKSENQSATLALNTNILDYDGVVIENAFAEFALNRDVINLATNAQSIALNSSVQINQPKITAKSVGKAIQFDVNWDKYSEVGSSGVVSGLINRSDYYAECSFFDFQVEVNDKSWVLNPNAKIAIDTANLYFNKVEFSSNNQLIGVDGIVSTEPNRELDVTVQNFDLQTINSFFEEQDFSTKGLLEGTVTVKNIFGNPFITSSLAVTDLWINTKHIGDGEFMAYWQNASKSIHINGGIAKFGKNNLVVSADYFPEREENQLKGILEFKNFDISTVEPFISTYVDELSGKVNGIVNLNGNLTEPLLDGELILKETEVRIVYLGTKYFINNKKLVIENDYFGLNAVDILDKKENGVKVGTLVGTILHENFSNWNFDVAIEAENLNVLNTSKSFDASYYGKAFVSGNFNISGYAQNLLMEVTAKTEKGTKFFIPLYTIEEIDQNDFIRFVNENPNEAIAQLIDNEYKVDLDGVQMNLDIEVTPDAELQLVFDETVGEVIRAQGAGNLNLEINTAGDFNMYGTYAISEGDYLFTLQNIINKKFILDPTSTISWDGNPYNAQLDIKAIYKVRTTINDFLTSIDSNSVNRKVPVNVELLMGNELNSPSIDFNIDFPTLDETTANTVKTRIGINQANTQLNNQEEVNKQVFSLLLLNSFYRSVGDGVVNGVEKSTTEVLSNQLSNWLSKASDKFDIGVAYNTGDEYSPSELQFALSTNLFNDRVSVETSFGSEFGNETSTNPNGETTLVGDFTIEYKIDKQGKLKARVFNRSNDFNELNVNTSARYVRGIGLFFKTEFNKLGDLFRRKEKVNPE